MIYQTHPSHGRHIAYNGLEAEANRKNGWKDVTKDEFYGAQKINVVEVVNPKWVARINSETDDQEHEKASAAYELKFGKKPHHRMTTESILKALDANGE